MFAAKFYFAKPAISDWITAIKTKYLLIALSAAGKDACFSCFFDE